MGTEPTEHECSCVTCDPSLASPEKLGPNHYRVSDPDTAHLRGNASLFVDGEDVTHSAFEFFLAVDSGWGWALLYGRDEDDHVHFCKKDSCRKGYRPGQPDADDGEAPAAPDVENVCRHRLIGRVELRMKAGV